MSYRPTKSQTERASALFDALLDLCHDIVTKRTPQLDTEGRIVTDDDGRPYFTIPSAAHMREARAIIDKLGISAVAAPGSKAGDVYDKAAQRGWTVHADIPPVDLEHGDAATG